MSEQSQMKQEPQEYSESSLVDEIYFSEKDIDKLIAQAMNKNWLIDAYEKVVTNNTPQKTYLLKLVEFNKIAILENDTFLQQNTEIEVLMVQLMKSRITKNEQMLQLQNHPF